MSVGQSGAIPTAMDEMCYDALNLGVISYGDSEQRGHKSSRTMHHSKCATLARRANNS